MSLNFVLRINEYPIGAFEAVRIDGEADPDYINTYRIRIYSKTLQLEWEGEVKHRYGDGAWALVERSMLAWRIEKVANGELRSTS